MTRTRAASQASSSKVVLTPQNYSALKTEQGVFTTPHYSEELKVLWRFKDVETATESAEALWVRFKRYRSEDDFVGMDMTRKFIQMGRTRSLRYALRKGGRKYEPLDAIAATKKRRRRASDSDRDDDVEEDHDGGKGQRGRKEIPRTGQVYDQSKLDGAGVFEDYLKRCWDDAIYSAAWEEWRATGKTKP